MRRVVRGIFVSGGWGFPTCVRSLTTSPSHLDIPAVVPEDSEAASSWPAAPRTRLASIGAASANHPPNQGAHDPHAPTLHSAQAHGAIPARSTLNDASARLPGDHAMKMLARFDAGHENSDSVLLAGFAP